MSILKTVAASKAARVGVALSLTGAALVGFAGSSEAAIVKSVVSPATGAGAGTAASTRTGVVTLTGGGFVDAGGTSQVAAAGAAWNTGTGSVQFNDATACPAAPATANGTAVYNVVAADLTVVSATRIVVNVPTLALGGTNPNYTSKAYRVCVYDTGNALLADASYTVYPKPQVTKVTPAAGPLTGGNTVTVVASNLTAKSTATINGLPLTGVKVAKDLKSLTGVVPATAAVPVMTSFTVLGSGLYNVVVSTEGGPSANNAALDDYEYVNAVTVSPKLASPSATTPVTVTGKGFLTMLNPVNGVPTAPAAVVIAKGQFDSTTATTAGTTASGTKVGDCGAVAVVSDTELVCTVPTGLAVGAYVITVTDNATGAIAIGAAHQYQSVVSSSAVITVAKS